LELKFELNLLNIIYYINNQYTGQIYLWSVHLRLA